MNLGDELLIFTEFIVWYFEIDTVLLFVIKGKCSYYPGPGTLSVNLLCGFVFTPKEYFAADNLLLGLI